MKHLDLNKYSVQELNSQEIRETEGGGPRWSKALGNFFGWWLSSYAQEESLGAFKL